MRRGCSFRDRRPGVAAVELFNLAADPGEKNNLAAANPEVVAKLRARIETYTHDAVPPKAEAQATGFKVPRVWGEAP
ncbi:MAG: hypothetical protein RLZZ221_1640 [Verrucomicrobiota bacterium]